MRSTLCFLTFPLFVRRARRIRNFLRLTIKARRSTALRCPPRIGSAIGLRLRRCQRTRACLRRLDLVCFSIRRSFRERWRVFSLLTFRSSLQATAVSTCFPGRITVTPFTNFWLEEGRVITRCLARKAGLCKACVRVRLRVNGVLSGCLWFLGEGWRLTAPPFRLGRFGFCTEGLGLFLALVGLGDLSMCLRWFLFSFRLSLEECLGASNGSCYHCH